MGKKLLSLQNRLEHLGVRLETISRLAFNYNKPEMLGTEFGAVLADLDAQQACNRYKWKGLPENLSGMQIESMLYYKAILAGFFFGGTLYILPYAQQQGVNVYGQSNAIMPVTSNGDLVGAVQKEFKQGLPLVSNRMGMIDKNAKAVLLYDRIPTTFSQTAMQARAVLNKDLIDFQCDLLGRIKNNLRNIDKKMIWYVDDESQANQMKNDLREAYGSTDPFVVMVRKPSMNTEQQGQPMQGKVDSETQSLFETWQSVNSIRCMAMGITNGGAFEKKERKITGELQGDQTQAELVLDAGLKMRQLFIDRIKFIYPEYGDILNKISVEINRDAQQDEVLWGMPENEEKGGDEE